MVDGLAGVALRLAALHAEEEPRPDKEAAQILLHPMGELLALEPPHSLQHVSLVLPVVSSKLSRLCV